MNTVSTSESRRSKLLQVRTDALTAEYVYSHQLGRLATISSSLILLSILTPIVILLALYPSKGTGFEPIVQALSYASSGILLLLAVAALVLNVESKKENFLSARTSNTFIANESQELIDNPSQDTAWFFRFASNQDSIDQKNVLKISKKLKIEAYRESLKRIAPGDSSVVCPVCRSSPFIFTPGDCELCGNSPAK